MNCMKCGRPINSLEDTVDDGSGIMVRMHRACASGVSVENVGSQEDIATMKHLNPDFQAPKATGVFTGGQQPLIRIRGAVAHKGGRPVYESDLTSKADAPEYGSSQCVLCGRPVSGDGVVRSRDHVAHAECVRILLEFVNQPTKPTKPPLSVQKAVPSRQAVLVQEDERLSREDARYLVRVLAGMIRAGEAQD